MWPNGKLPTSKEWRVLAAGGFKDYRLKVCGLVENPVELSLEQLRAMSKLTQVTLHHCIQGWSGIAEWGGLPVAELMRIVRPKPNVKAVLFYSFGEGLEGGQYYDSHTIDNARHPQTLLAYEMNFMPLTEVHGAPVATPGRKPARLQDGEMDQGDRIRRGLQTRLSRRRRLQLGPRVLRHHGRHLKRRRGVASERRRHRPALGAASRMARRSYSHALGVSVWAAEVPAGSRRRGLRCPVRVHPTSIRTD